MELNNKLNARLSVLKRFNSNLKLPYRYSLKDIKQILKHFSRLNFKIGSSVPMWFYSYNQGYFLTALQDLE